MAPSISTPTSIDEFIDLCYDNGDRVVTRAMALEYGLDQSCVDVFIAQRLHGRTFCSLKQLMPFVRNGHSDWPGIMRLIVGLLKHDRYLPENFSIESAGITEPPEQLPDDMSALV